MRMREKAKTACILTLATFLPWASVAEARGPGEPQRADSEPVLLGRLRPSRIQEGKRVGVGYVELTGYGEDGRPPM